MTDTPPTISSMLGRDDPRGAEARMTACDLVSSLFSKRDDPRGAEARMTFNPVNYG